MEELIVRLGLDPEIVTQQLFDWGGRVIAALLIFLVGRWIAGRIANVVARATEKAGVDQTLTKFLRSVVYMTLLVFVLYASAQTLRIPMTSFFALLGAAGLAVGLALKDSLSNFSSGVMLVFFRPFKVGDYVEAGGVAGTVDAIRIFNTVMRTPDNRVITVPNSLIYGATITNYSAMDTRRIDLVIGVGYGDDVARAREIMQAVLDADERILADPRPVVMLLELADSSVNFAVRPWVATSDYSAVRADTLETIKRALEDNGLSIPYPQTDVHLIGEVAAGS